MVKKRVLHITDGLHPRRGGLPTAVLNITGLFQLAEISYEILSIGDNPDQLPAHTIPFSNSENARFAVSNKAIEWFKNNYKDYSLIYFHSVWNVTILNIYRIVLKANVPYCISPHGSLDPFDLQKKSLFKKVLGFFIVNKILTRAKYIFCTSQIEKEVLFYFGPKVNNAIVLPLPVDYDEGKFGEGDIFRRKYHIDPNQFVFLFLSRINYKKGLDNFILALSELVAEGKLPKEHIKLVIAGDDQNPYSDEIKILIKNNALDDVVQFVGLVVGQNKADAYNAADLFILPSKNENFGLAIVEALQTGTPVLISKNVYIYKELFEDKEAAPGWVCDNELSDLKPIILNAFQDRENYAQRIKSAFEVGQMFTSLQLKETYKKYFIQ
jgi:glycosyltransferase involved in cell wall biosynthesis